jgi:hypothetical protein
LRTFVRAKAIVDYGGQAVTMTAQEPIGIARPGTGKLWRLMVANFQMTTLAAGLVLTGTRDLYDRVHQTSVATLTAGTASSSGGTWQGIPSRYA